MSSGASPVDVGALPTLDDYGYAGGRQDLRAFCARVFAPGAPRFLRGPGGALAVFRHADVRALAAAPDMSALAPAIAFPGLVDGPTPAVEQPGFAVADLIKNQLFTSNPPLNPALRRVMLNQLGPKPIAAYGAQTRALAADILAHLPLGAPVDLVRDLAEPLVGRFWGGLLGMTDADAVAAAAEARRMSPMLHLRPDPTAQTGVDAAATAYRALVEGAGDRALIKGGCPVVEGIAKDLSAIDIADDLQHVGYVPKTAGAFLAGNLFDGFHTAVLAVANTAYALLHRPGVLETVRRAPEKAAAAVAESLRLEPPVIQLSRLTTSEIRHDDIILPKGVHVMLMWGAANHDPAAFPDPEAFDLERSQQGATTFGGGAHICPGRFAALLLARSALEAIIDMNLEVTLTSDESEWVDGSVMSQLRRLSVVLAPRAERPLAARP
jgi:cytochrome P450